LLSGALMVGECVELVHQPLGMDPTQRMLTDSKLAGVVADNHRAPEKPVRLVTEPVLPRSDLARTPGFLTVPGDRGWRFLCRR
jgi:hypothetical protein